MKKLSDVAADLRKLADQLAAAGNPPPLPKQELTMTEAAARLGLACETVHIQVSYWSKGLASPLLEFTVWDGKNHYAAPTLNLAVEACLLAQRGAEVEAPTPGVVDAVLDNAAAPAF